LKSLACAWGWYSARNAGHVSGFGGWHALTQEGRGPCETVPKPATCLPPSPPAPLPQERGEREDPFSPCRVGRVREDPPFQYATIHGGSAPARAGLTHPTILPAWSHPLLVLRRDRIECLPQTIQFVVDFPAGGFAVLSFCLAVEPLDPAQQPLERHGTQAAGRPFE
jgi:hypothetical protein